MEFKELQTTDNLPASEYRIREFIDAWKEEFGEELSNAEARIRLAELVELYCLAAKPLPAKLNPHCGLWGCGDVENPYAAFFSLRAACLASSLMLLLKVRASRRFSITHARTSSMNASMKCANLARFLSTKNHAIAWFFG